MLKQDGDKLTVIAGYKGAERYPGEKVEWKGESLKFELNPPSDSANVLRFDLILKDGKLTGKFTQSREGQSFKGTLSFTRQQ